jgi:hypothetical protein
LLSLQNHVIAPHLRGGAGIMLLRHASRGAITLSPGVHGRLGEAYRRLGYLELPSFWTSRIVHPVRAARQLAMRRLGRGSGGTAPPRIDLEKVRRALGSVATVTGDPSDQRLCALASTINAQAAAAGGTRVDWTAEILRWRFFCAAGPRHVLIENGTDWAILSLGRREGVTVSRLLEASWKDTRFMRTLSAAARAMGAAVGLSFTTSAAVRDQQLASGWRLRKDAPATFAHGVEKLSVTAGAGDVGFEAFGTEIGG